MVQRQSWHVEPLAGDFSVTVLAEPPDLPPDVARQVEECWIAEQAANPRSFDGVLHGLESFDGRRVVLRRWQFRHFIAERERPGLLSVPPCRFRTLGVAALLFSPDGLVLGQRAGHVANHRGEWEPAPAGGLDRPDPLAVLFEELNEELGLLPVDVGQPQPLCLCRQGDSVVHDLLFRLDTRLTEPELIARHREEAGDEYSRIRCIPLPDLPAFLGSTAPDWALLLLRPDIWSRLSG